MTENSNLPAPRKGSGAIVDICLGIVADIASVAGLPTSTVAEMLKALKQKRISDAEQVLITELRAGRVDLENSEVEEFIPIAYHFFRAAEEGEALKTLRIFARIIAGQLENNTLDASTFKFRASSLSGLPERELKLLKEYLDKTEEVFSTSKVTGKGAHERELRVQKNVESALVPELYVSDHDLSAAASLLAGRGLLVPVERAVFGGALTNYFASPLAIDIKSLARDLD